MTLAAPPPAHPGWIEPGPSRGHSKAAALVAEQIAQISRHWDGSRSLSAALDELDQLHGEASHDNWDGHGGHALDPASYEHARRLLRALRLAYPSPEVSVDADGEAAFDWVFGKGRRLAASIGGDGRITFAGIDGPRSLRGTDWLSDAIPEPLVFALSKLATRRS